MSEWRGLIDSDDTLDWSTSELNSVEEVEETKRKKRRNNGIACKKKTKKDKDKT